MPPVSLWPPSTPSTSLRRPPTLHRTGMRTLHRFADPPPVCGRPILAAFNDSPPPTRHPRRVHDASWCARGRPFSCAAPGCLYTRLRSRLRRVQHARPVGARRDQVLDLLVSSTSSTVRWAPTRHQPRTWEGVGGGSRVRPGLSAGSTSRVSRATRQGLGSCTFTATRGRHRRARSHSAAAPCGGAASRGRATAGSEGAAADGCRRLGVRVVCGARLV